MQQLPIGEQNFSLLRKADMVYVDKTRHIHQLITNSRYCFLSRPRRFGKSLTLSTIEHIFRGEKELFDGLWIENNWDWTKKHPVVHVSFSKLDYQNLSLEGAIIAFLDERAAQSGIVLSEKSAKSKLSELVLKLAAQESPVVLLIDEYDKPIIDYLEKDELPIAKANRNTLKTLYSGLKDGEIQAALRFFLLTGVSKFSQVSLFSDLNYLSDITLNKRYAALVGYTQEELEHFFDSYIDLLHRSFPQVSHEELLLRIKIWYNGYSWDGHTRVYNPFSVLLLFENQSFRDYWFKSGTPTFLIKLLKEQGYYDFDHFKASFALFDSYELETMDSRSLMFQTGYLTVLSINEDRGLYTLGYPNREVEEATHNYLIASLLDRMPADSRQPILQLEEAFAENKPAKVVEIINSLLKDLPSLILEGKNEHFYHALVHLHFRYLGIYIESEVHTSDGRMDAVVQTPTHVYILEFKLDKSAEAALNQIRDKKYADKYRSSGKTITGIGVSFDTAKRAVGDWATEDM